MSCKCQACGSYFKVDIIVPNELWERIKPPGKSEDAGLLCGPCIAQLIEANSDYDCFELRRMA
jgi:hypothetical protein